MLHPIPHQRGQGEPIIELDDATCGYQGQPVLKHIDLRIMAGDFVGLLGPSGSGKTTLLRTILGATRLFGGTVKVKGVATSRKKPRAGYVPQLETIDWNFPVTVEEVVMMGCTMNNPLFPWHRTSNQKLALGMMERLGISLLRKRHIRELSGGQQQRVFLARALVSSPDLLLLDEPTSGVDIKTRDEVMHLLHDLNHQGITVILTTHEINAVAVHLPWLVCLNGHIVADGPPSEVITTETLLRTYGARMPVVEYQGMPLVAESPHLFGRHRPRAMETETPGGTLRDSSHEKPRELLIQGLKKREEERV
jgi:zinc/manganese transport system ATP-binding protein/zinc transport system ATP-binding protein